MDLEPGAPSPGFRAAMAASYDAVARRREAMGEAPWRWSIADAFLSLMRAEDKASLLEIGAGVGYTSRWFADRGVAVVATDLSPEQVALCRAKGLEAHTRDMYHLGFPPATFDAVWAMNCIHHVPNRDLPQVLEGIRNVLVPGGLCYLGVWGGRDLEGADPADEYPPPRFFSFRSDSALLGAVAAVFEVETFATFVPEDDPDPDGFHMQSFVVRRPRRWRGAAGMVSARRGRGPMTHRDDLRPLERAVLRRRDEGLGTDEIARRFRRSPEHIERIIGYTAIPVRRAPERPGAPHLRPLERRVLRLRAAGHGHDLIGKRFNRSASHMRRVEGLAYLRTARALLR